MKGKSILVVGGGIGGLTTAIEAAEVGYEVFLVEKEPYLGGRVTRMHRYFPKLCAPDCGLEINFKRIKAKPNIKFFTQAEVEDVAGSEGNYDVTIKLAPRMVNDNCTACGRCVEACPVDRVSDYNYGMGKTKAIYLPHLTAFPMKYAIDKEVCQGSQCAKCVEACPYGAIDLEMAEERLNINVGSVVVATGWKPYDATRIDYLHFGEYPNVITNVMMERLAALDGPTAGKILRPSDGKEPKSIAFVQCAGSRDENHLPYCSGVCCLASLKQINYIKEEIPDAQVYMFYIDIRTPGYLEDFYRKVQGYDGVSMLKGKVAKITEQSDGDLKLELEDVAQAQKISPVVEMVVLATGIQPSSIDTNLPGDITYDSYGFIDSSRGGIIGAGCARRPGDVSSSVRDATGAALKAIQSAGGGNG